MRNLLGRLRERSPEDLRRIADCWEVPLGGQTHADYVGQLYRAMRDPWAIRDRVEVLGATEWAVVEALLADEAARDASDLAVVTGLPEPTVAAAIAALEDCGLLYRERRGHGYGGDRRERELGEEATPAPFLARELATLLRRVQEERLLGPALGPDAPLRALLSTLEVGELEGSAEAWGLRVTPGVIGRDALTDEILARVALPEQRRATVGGVPPGAARVFEALREAGGALPVAALRERLDLRAPALREVGRALGERLLVWHAFVAGERVLFIPRDVLAPQRPARDAPPPLTPVEATPPNRPGHPYAAAWDLLTILRRLAGGELEWREGDEERNATALRRLAPTLWATAGGGARPGYVPFLLHLAREEGLVRAEDETLVATATTDGWRGRPFGEQTRVLFDRWRGTRDWPEGLGQDDLQIWGVDWPAMRAATLEELRTCTVGVWYDAATLALRIARRRPALLGGSFNVARASGGAGTRDEVSAAAVQVALHGGLVPLGVLAEAIGARADGGGHPALALTELGGWLLGLRPGFAPRAVGDHALAVGADFEILLFRPTPRRLWALGAISEPVRLDTVSTYRLTESAVRRGIASGLTLEQIETFLERGGGRPLPQNVAFTLREWSRDHAGVRLARALVLRLDDAAAIGRLGAGLARAGLPAAEPLADGRLLLTLTDPAEPEVVLEALRAAGFTPHWVREARAAPGKAPEGPPDPASRDGAAASRRPSTGGAP